MLPRSLKWASHLPISAARCPLPSPLKKQTVSGTIRWRPTDSIPAGTKGSCADKGPAQAANKTRTIQLTETFMVNLQVDTGTPPTESRHFHGHKLRGRRNCLGSD